MRAIKVAVETSALLGKPSVVLLPRASANWVRVLAFAVGAWVLGAGMVLAHTDEVAEYVRTQWGVPATYTRADIQRAFSAPHYGFTRGDYVAAVLGASEIFDLFAQGESMLAFEKVSNRVTGGALTEIRDHTLGLGFLTIPKILRWALTAQLRVLALRLQETAFLHQHTLYFLARPFNSAAEIRDLTPFDLLNGVDITKEGRGWLFDYTGYLRPYPNNQGLTPADFWLLAESAWEASSLTAASFATERDAIRNEFLAYLPIAKANGSLSVAADSVHGQITLSWACIPGLRYGIESSGNLQTWQSEGSVTPTGSTIEWVFPVNFTVGQKFFRLRILP